MKDTVAVAIPISIGASLVSTDTLLVLTGLANFRRTALAEVIQDSPSKLAQTNHLESRVYLRTGLHSRNPPLGSVSR